MVYVRFSLAFVFCLAAFECFGQEATAGPDAKIANGNPRQAMTVRASAVSAAKDAGKIKREWVRARPVATDGQGPGAGIYFKYRRAGNSRAYVFTKGQPVLIRAWGDSCRYCLLGHLRFRVVEDTAKKDGERIEFNGPAWNGSIPRGELSYRWIAFTPKGERYTGTTTASRTTRSARGWVRE